MSKYILVGDSHWGVSGNNQQMIDQAIKTWQYIIDIANDYKCEGIIDCGDFLDKRKEIDANLLQIICDNVMNKLGSLKLYLDVGNHNLYYKETSTVNNISVFEKMFSNVKVVDKPFTIDNIDIIPWVNKDNVNDIKTYMFNTTSKYCVGHWELAGFPFDKSRVAEVKEEKIERNLLKMYEKVFSGHYHISSNKDNIMYLGTPHQLTWIDVDVEKYIYVLDTETGDITTIVVPHKMFHQYVIDEDNWKEYCDEEHLQGRVKIFYNDTFDKEKLNAIQTQFVSINPDVQFIKRVTEKKENKEIVLDETETLLDLILQYVNHINPENKDLVESLIKKVYV